MKTQDQIKRAHDVLCQIVDGTIPYVAGAHMDTTVAICRNVLCWVLDDGHNDYFQKLYGGITGVLEAAGMRFADGRSPTEMPASDDGPSPAALSAEQHKQDAPERLDLDVHVTAVDISGAISNDCFDCAVAHAVQRAAGAEPRHVSARYAYINVISAGVCYRGRTPDAVREFMVASDYSDPVEPFHFHIRLKKIVPGSKVKS